MVHIFGIVAAVGLLAFVLWLLTSSGSRRSGGGLDESETIDVSDPRQIGSIVGLSGGQIPDAATAQYAIKRFEESHGRKAAMGDLGTVVGLSKTV